MRTARMLHALEVLDVELAARTRGRDCAHCGGPLHTANYLRKPRGGPWPVPDAMALRRSLCCAREGCRRRTQVPSALFLGRRVYLGVIVVLGAVLQHGVTARRVTQLARDLDIDRRTLTRWRQWWLETFVTSHAYACIQAAIVPPPDVTALPHSLVAHYSGADPPQRAAALMRHLARFQEAG